MVRCRAPPRFTTWLRARSVDARPEPHRADVLQEFAATTQGHVKVRADFFIARGSWDTHVHQWHPLPWYIAGPLIGLVVPALLLIGNKPFGISSNFRDVCAAIEPGRIEFFNTTGSGAGWNLAFPGGQSFVGAVAAWQLAPPLTVAISSGTVAALHQLGSARSDRPWRRVKCSRGRRSSRSRALSDGRRRIPGRVRTAYAGGCNLGHAIAGPRRLPAGVTPRGGAASLPRLIATYFVLPLILR